MLRKVQNHGSPSRVRSLAKRSNGLLNHPETLTPTSPNPHTKIVPEKRGTTASLVTPLRCRGLQGHRSILKEGTAGCNEISLVEGGGRLVTVKEDSKISTFRRGKITLNTHTAIRREVELLTEGDCLKEATCCHKEVARLLQGGRRSVPRRPQITREQSDTSKRRRRRA
jgi:hypothetical protein